MQLDCGCSSVSEVSCGQQQTSYESVILQQRLGPQDGWAAYAILDGHNGDAVAKFVSSQLLQQLVTRLPSAATYACSSHGFAEQTRKAVAAAFLATAQALHSSSDLDGAAAEGCSCAATLALHTGALLTVANVGTSSCWLDLGRTVINLTTDHRAGADDDETDRLATVGGRIARIRTDLSGPAAEGEDCCGPLRVWPGGQQMTRAFTQQPAMPVVIPHPHIQQVFLPSRACRLVLANEAVWAAFPAPAKAASMLRSVSIDNAAATVLATAAGKLRARGDRAVLVADFLADPDMSFKDQVRQDTLSRTSVASSLGGARSPFQRLSSLGGSMHGGTVNGGSSTPGNWLQRLSSPGMLTSSGGGVTGWLQRKSTSFKRSSSSSGSSGGAGAGQGMEAAASATIHSLHSVRSNSLRAAANGAAFSSRSSSRASPAFGLKAGNTSGRGQPASCGCLPFLSCFWQQQLPGHVQQQQHQQVVSRVGSTTPSVEQSQLSGASMKFAARLDSLSAYCHGFYGPLVQLVTLLDSQLAIQQRLERKQLLQAAAAAAAAAADGVQVDTPKQDVGDTLQHLLVVPQRPSLDCSAMEDDVWQHNRS